MGRLILSRLIHGLLLLAGVSLLTFALTELAPGEFLDEMRLDPRLSPETVEAWRERYGLDRSWIERYLAWVGAVLRGDLGHSLALNAPAGPLLLARGANTLLLTGTALALSWALALPLGVWAAGTRRRWGRVLFAGGTSLLLAVPEVVLALGLLLLALESGALPVGGMVSLGASDLGPGARLLDLAAHALLPVVALVLASAPTLARHVHAAVAEALAAPCLTTAASYGVPRRRLLFRHALKLAAPPLISLAGLSFGALLSSSLLVEVVMGWPGMGPLLLTAILARDLHLVVGAVLGSTVLLLAGNLGADLLLRVADPRVREAG